MENIEEIYLDDILEYNENSINAIEEEKEEEKQASNLFEKAVLDLHTIAVQKETFKEKISAFVLKKFHGGEIDRLQALYDKMQPVHRFYDETERTLIKWQIDRERMPNTAPLQSENEGIEHFFSAFKAQQEKVSYHMTALSAKQEQIEKNLFNLVKDPSTPLQERTQKMVPLMEAQEKINMFIQDLKNILSVIQ
ncbi:hypothetical protein [Bacillus taeanensis]|uniref:Uncharacterized protein n=1 Tax=Bacillus taeanensis TaxID=273032 RepID=A0A366Y151_9BACI|nr:hypothetical protein [Bacillus taeanensis]RBW71095.1 hypothetical protein DS031_03630 [Bacillus taeanensis]